MSLFFQTQHHPKRWMICFQGAIRSARGSKWCKEIMKIIVSSVLGISHNSQFQGHRLPCCTTVMLRMTLRDTDLSMIFWFLVAWIVTLASAFKLSLCFVACLGTILFAEWVILSYNHVNIISRYFKCCFPFFHQPLLFWKACLCRPLWKLGCPLVMWCSMPLSLDNLELLACSRLSSHLCRVVSVFHAFFLMLQSWHRGISPSPYFE